MNKKERKNRIIQNLSLYFYCVFHPVKAIQYVRNAKEWKETVQKLGESIDDTLKINKEFRAKYLNEYGKNDSENGFRLTGELPQGESVFFDHRNT